MIKKYQKFVCLAVFLLFFLFFGFFYLSISKVSANGLEVSYPTLSGQTLSSGTEFPDYVKYLFNLGMFLGFSSVFLSLMLSGAMYLISPIKPNFLSAAKERISGAMSGLLILLTIYLIITTINPQLSILNLNKPQAIPPPPAPKQAPGVYLYNTATDCPGKPAQIVTTKNVPDFGEVLRNKLQAVGVVQDPNDTQTAFMTIVYSNTNFWGKCQEITTTESGIDQTCENSPLNWAASASVYKYDFNPAGEGVYFYRQSYFNDCGGYFEVSNDDIINAPNGVYVKKLDDLSFLKPDNPPADAQINCPSPPDDDCTVPKEDRDCIAYDKYGDCTKTDCPKLGGENISSVKISPAGNYLVLFVYFAPGDTPAGPWTSCQEFPTVDDVNLVGPQQMKWQNIRNDKGLLPNYVIIFPAHKNQ